MKQTLIIFSLLVLIVSTILLQIPAEQIARETTDQEVILNLVGYCIIPFFCLTLLAGIFMPGKTTVNKRRYYDLDDYKGPL